MSSNLIEPHELSHIKFSNGLWTLDKLHLTLLRAQLASNQLLKFHGRRDFDGSELLNNEQLLIDPIAVDTIELSTRFVYDENGFYKS